MSRSDFFHRLNRYLRVALHCQRTDQSAQDVLDQVKHAEHVNRERRRLLTAVGAGAIVTTTGSLSGTLRRAFAAPGVSGGVAIVGAGLAGLSCGYALAGKGVRADLFEGSSRAGGRCFSLSNFFPGQVAERGGEFIDTGHEDLQNLASEVGVEMQT